MHIIIAIPVYDGKLPIETTTCLFNELAAANMCGDNLEVKFLSNCSHPAMGRNQLAQEFMDSDADRLIFLDSDVTCNVGDILKLAHTPVDFVGGAYRYKIAEESYPVGWLEGKELWSDALGLIEVAALPGGFLSLSKNVFTKLKEAFPDRGYEHFGNKAHCYFQMLFTDGRLCGEDSYFCKEWRDIGGKVYLNPEVNLTHWDFNKPFKGHIGNWLKNRPQPTEVTCPQQEI